MANTTATKQVDALGFDRMEIANVRRCYAANKTNYAKLNKLYEKVAAISKDVETLKAQINAWDGPVLQMSKEKLGVELSSEEILLAHTDFEKFCEVHPEFKKEAPEATAEETQEPVPEVADAPQPEAEAAVAQPEGPEIN